MCANLVSVSQIAKNGNRVSFFDDKCHITNKKNKIIATASLVDDVYRMDCVQKSKAMFASLPKLKMKKLDADLWHRRLGHMGHYNWSNVLAATEGMDFYDSKSVEACGTCPKGKQTRMPFNHTGTRARSRGAGTDSLRYMRSNANGIVRSQTIFYHIY